jgi:uncharacterized protein (DUF1330 family)
MAAYVYANLKVTDEAAFAEYRQAVPATIAAYGGRYLVRGGAFEVLEGEARPERLVILEFPDMATLRAWYRSDAYRPLLALRKRATDSQIVAIDGL